MMTERFNSSPKHERYDQAQQAPGSPAHGKFGTKHIGHLGDDPNRDANRMDEKRKEHIAYEYLCHLEEAKKWIESCVEEELPLTTELEQALRNGVILCKLGHYYAPEIIPYKKIYDLDESKYKVKGLHFKHTDNFNFWLNSLMHIGMPKIFYPITTDLYDRKNMPRVIYCIHALSLYLHKLGKAPLIEDLLGTATFTEEEISAMRKELDKYGIQMPHFGKIGGILANEITVDEAAVHAAILAINEVLDKDDPKETLAALLIPSAMLAKVERENSNRYHNSLCQSKRDKALRSEEQVTDVDESERDVYEFILTQGEIQDQINHVNTCVKREIAEAKFRQAVSNVNTAILSGDAGTLLNTLRDEEARLSEVNPDNIQWYVDVLSKAVRDMSEDGEGRELTRDEIQDILRIANEIAENTRLIEEAVLSVNSALEGGDPDKTLEALLDEHLDLAGVYQENKDYYQEGLLHKKREKEEALGEACLLTEDEIQNVILEMNKKAEYDRSTNRAIEKISSCALGEEPEDTLQALQSSLLSVGEFDEQNYVRYHKALQRAVEEKGQDLTLDEVNEVIEEVNNQLRLEKLFADGMEDINCRLRGGEPGVLLQALHNPHCHLDHIQEENALHYLSLLQAMAAAKAETGDPDAHLTKEEIQSAIDRANAQEVAVLSVNSALEGGDPDKTLEALLDEHLDLAGVYQENNDYYQEGLLHKKREKEEEQGEPSHLTKEDIQGAVLQMNEKAAYDRSVNRAIEKISSCALGEEPEDTLQALQSSLLSVGEFDEQNYVRYHKALQRAVEEKGQDLTLDEVNEVIEEVNNQLRLEKLFADGMEDINCRLKGEEPGVLLQALHNPHCHLDHIQEENALHYLSLLQAMAAAKAERTGDPDAQLTKDEVQSAISKANAQTLECIEFVEAVSAINAAIAGGDARETLSALKSPTLGIRSITEECAQTYQEKLAEAKAQKEAAVGVTEGWSEHHTRQGLVYFHNRSTGASQWERPEDFSGESQDLNREEIQDIVTKVTADYDRWALLKANEPVVVQLQSLWRGRLVRKAFHHRLDYLNSCEKEAVRVQSVWKGFKQRRAYKERLDYLNSQTDAAIKLESLVKMWKCRKSYRNRLHFFRDNEDAVVKIQSFWRAKRAKRDYKQLVEVSQPPTSAVRRFLALLEQSDIDFSEELECQRLKAQVVQKIRSNQQLEQDLSIMDIKIGLLVKNRISLEDVVSHTHQVSRNKKRHGATAGGQDPSSGVSTGIGGLSKGTQEKIEGYQHLFYLMQTKPHYFAKLIFEMPQSKTNRFMENVILTVFNYASNNREQYLLLKLFETALNEEVSLKVDKIMDIVTGNPTVIKMVVHYTRGEQRNNVLRDLFGPLVREILGHEDWALQTTPVDVYRSWINQMEMQTGEATKLPYDVSNDQALDHEEVRKKIGRTVEILKDVVGRFQQSIFDSIDNIPYGMRYIAMQLRLALHKKFPEAPTDEILKVVGNLLYYRYMNPAIVAPDAFDIVDVSVESQLSTDQRRNLASIAKVLQAAASGKPFEGENAALASVNPFIADSFVKFREFFLKASTVTPAEEKFGIDEYSDVIMLTKPIIYISVKEICSTHSLLVDHEDAIAPDPNDQLHVILRDLGPSPSVESLLGGVREPAPGEDKADVITEAGKQELPLTLTNKFEGLAEDDSSNMKALFVRTKRMVVDVLRVQAGENLTEVLYTPASSEQEEEHQALIQRREKQEVSKMQRSSTMKKSESMVGDRNLPLEGMKRKIMRNLRTLEQEGMVNSTNDYQEVISAIAKDIRNQHRYRQQRKLELTRLQETLDKLNKKTTFYEEQMDYYHLYVKACLDNLAKAGSGGKGKRAARAARLAEGEFKKQTIKYTAQKLYEKGVILEIEGLPNHQFKYAVFEITSVGVGTFEVLGKFMGFEVQKVELVFQDLLQLQYEGLAVMKMFGRAKINVNLLIFLINKKFYGRVS